MKVDHQIERIINASLPAIANGEECLESILAKFPEITTELRPRLEAVIWLQQAKLSCATRPGFIIDSRKYLETKIQSMPHNGFWQHLSRRYTTQRWVFNIAAPILLITLFVLIINSLVLTSRLSIPGDPLYTTKLLLEDIQLVFTFNPVEKTDLYIHLSRERTTEFVDLVLEGDYEVLPAAASRLETEIIDSLHSINNLSSQDVSQKQPTTSELRETLSNEIFILNTLKGSSPPSAHPWIELAIQVAESGIMALR
jgi:hypothetical protein